MKKTAAQQEFDPCQATTVLPADYRQQATLDLSKSKKAIAGAVVTGCVLIIAVGSLLVQFTRFLRPTALGSIGLRNILAITPNGQLSILLPIADAVVAFILVVIIHELVHGAFYWWFAGQRPTLGVKGLYIYVAAPPEVYFPRNQYLIVGLAPLVLLTLVGLMLILVVPVAAVSILSLFVAFNAAGAAGDLVIAARLLRCSPDKLMRDTDTGVIVYGPQKNRTAV
jgi:hypothetical protein